MTRFTIIGGKGFIGLHLAKHLKKEGLEFWIPERDDPKLFKEDLGNVFYCAGLTADYAVRTFDTVNAHVCLLNSVIQKSRYNSLVYLSSTRLYDSVAENAVEDMSLSLNPNNHRHLYDLSKTLGESICLVGGAGKARIARLSCVYKNQYDPEGFLPNLLRDILNKKNNILHVNSSPFIARDYVHLDDVIRALILIVTKGKQPIYNVASGENILNSLLFTALEELSGIKIIAHENGIFNSPPIVSILKMKEEFGWQPTSTLEKIKNFF